VRQVAAVLPKRRSDAELETVPWRWVGSIAAVLTAVLVLAAPGYGYHRDELYFRLLGHHLAWGYTDQPPLTPLLARVATAVFGDNLVAIRVPAAVGAAFTVVLTALLARELGGTAAAQVRAAAGTASAALVLIAGHVLLTVSIDLPLTAAVILFAVRAILRGDSRWWLAAGAVGGLALYNKQLIALVGVAFLAGVLIVGPRSLLRDRWLWLGALLALVIGLPNLIYQIAHDWPQVDMARAINRTDGSDNRSFFVPLQLVLLGAFLVPTWIRGFRELLRRQSWRPVRAFAIAYLAGCVITFVSGGQAYYVINLLLVLYAAGCVAATANHVGRAWIPIALNAVVGALIALPIVALSALGDTPIPDINQATRDQVGWPRMVDLVAEAYQTIPATDRSGAVVFAENYGEAGAVDRFGPEQGLPGVPVYSGLNALWDLGPPPDRAAQVILVGLGPITMHTYFVDCTITGTIDNGVGVDNEEQGRTIAVCAGTSGPWSTIWPALRHLG
jgi:4-amino-4-deoxy-L-arabinose transferase-like glycosyltransferase